MCISKLDEIKFLLINIHRYNIHKMVVVDLIINKQRNEVSRNLHNFKGTWQLTYLFIVLSALPLQVYFRLHSAHQVAHVQL